MKKTLIILTLVIITIIIGGIITRNYLYSKKRPARKDLKYCPYEHTDEYFNKVYTLLKKKNIKVYTYIFEKNKERREVENAEELISSLIDAKDYASSKLEKKWIRTEKEYFKYALGMKEDVKFKFISIPKEEEENILKNIDKIPGKKIYWSCYILEVMLKE